MNEIKLKDLQVGQKYYIHQFRDEDTRAPITPLKYVAVCTKDYTHLDWYEFYFEIVKGINTEDPENGIDICIDDWGIYKIYIDSSESFRFDSSALISQKNEIIERAMINSILRRITGDPTFKFY
jgi:hypothetical protein